VRRIIKAIKPKAALGVACYKDLNRGMQELSKMCAVLGVPLLKDGCVETKVDAGEIIRMMRLGIEDERSEPKCGGRAKA